MIGSVRCAASACADDICLCATSNTEAQTLLNISAEFANMERYLLQPAKSVHIKVCHKRSKPTPVTFFMNDSELPTVSRATHLGIIRTETLLGNQKENVDENLKKARRAAYSLFGSGYRGHNGLNISTIVHLYSTYVSPILLYGLELLLPPASLVNKLETFQRKFVKEILQLPDTTANPAVYLITGLLPIQAQIHLRALSCLHNLSTQGAGSIEKQILERQMQMKSIDSNSWITAIRLILWKYELGSPEEVVTSPPSKYAWKARVYAAVNKHWAGRINDNSKLYSTLLFLREDDFRQGKVLPILSPEFTSRESDRLKVKLRFLTGTYLLQTTRKNFNQYDIDPRCQLCKQELETVSHFVLECTCLESVRKTVLPDVEYQWQIITNSDFSLLNQDKKVQVIINCWSFLKARLKTPKHPELHEFEKHCSRLLFSLDCSRRMLLAALA